MEGSLRVDSGGKVERGAREAACRAEASQESKGGGVDLRNKGGSSEGT